MYDCCVFIFFHGYAAIVYNFHMTAMLLLSSGLCFIFSVFSAWVSCFRCHLVYKLFMPSTAVNSYFGICAFVALCDGTCVGTNKVKSLNDKHILTGIHANKFCKQQKMKPDVGRGKNN